MPEPGEKSVFRSTMGPPFSHIKARKVPSLIFEWPTTCPSELMANPKLLRPRFPRSVITPFLQRNASCVCEPVKSDTPTTSPASLIHRACTLSPPRVPRSLGDPRSHKYPWL